MPFTKIFRASHWDQPLYDGNLGNKGKGPLKKNGLYWRKEGCKVTSGFGEMVERFLGFKNAHCSVRSTIKICQ